MKTQRETAAITQQKQKVIPYKTTTMQARKKIWPLKQQGSQQKKFKIVDEVFKVWSFGKIINQDKNIMQRMKPTALFNLTFFYCWFSWNATNDSQVLHILEDKSRFTCITGFTDHIPILGTFHALCAKFGPNHVSCT